MFPSPTVQRITDSLSSCSLGSSLSAEAKNWFAVFTTPRHEKRVQEHLRVREIECFLPLFHAEHRWKDGTKHVLQLPLFASYVFVCINRGGRGSVLEVPGVISIVGNGRSSWSVPDSYISFLREGLRQGRIEPHPCLVEGTKVSIRSGPMAGTEGVLLRTKNNCRVVVTLELIMKSVRVEVEMNDIELVVPDSSGYVVLPKPP